MKKNNQEKNKQKTLEELKKANVYIVACENGVSVSGTKSDLLTLLCMTFNTLAEGGITEKELKTCIALQDALGKIENILRDALKKGGNNE